METPTKYESEIENCERCKNNAVVQWKCITCDHKICLNCKNFHAKIRTLQAHQIIPFEGNRSEVKNLTEIPPISKTCDRCRSTRNVEWKCSDCDHLLCYHCKEFHPKIRRYQNHEIISITNDTKIDTKQKERGSDKYCMEHPDQLPRAFCKDCDHQVCMKCAAGEHNTHEIITMSTILEKQKQLADTIKEMKQKLAEMEKENKALRLKQRYSETFLSEITKKWEKGKKKDKKLKALIDNTTAEKEMVQKRQDKLMNGIEKLQTAIQNAERKRYSRNYSELTNLIVNLEVDLSYKESDTPLLELVNSPRTQEESNCAMETIRNSKDYPNKAKYLDNEDNNQLQSRGSSSKLQDRTNESSTEIKSRTTEQPRNIQGRTSEPKTDLQIQTNEKPLNLQTGPTEKPIKLQNRTDKQGNISRLTTDLHGRTREPLTHSNFSELISPETPEIPSNKLSSTYSTNEDPTVSKASKIPVYKIPLTTESLITMPTMPASDSRTLQANNKQSDNINMSQDNQGQQMSSDISTEVKSLKVMLPDTRNGSVRKKVHFSTDNISQESQNEDVENSRSKKSNLLQRIDNVMQNSAEKHQSLQQKVKPIVTSDMDEMQNSTDNDLGQQKEVPPPNRSTITSYRSSYMVTRGRKQPGSDNTREQSELERTTEDRKISNNVTKSENSVKSVTEPADGTDKTETKLKARFYISPFKSSHYQSPFQSTPSSLLQNFQTHLTNPNRGNSINESSYISPTESNQSPVCKSSLYQTQQNSDKNVKNDYTKTQDDKNVKQEQMEENLTKEKNYTGANVKTTMINNTAKIPPTPASKPPKLMISTLINQSDSVSATNQISQSMPEVPTTSTSDTRETTQDLRTEVADENQSSVSTYPKSKLQQPDTTYDEQTIEQQKMQPTSNYRTNNTYAERTKSATNLLQKTRATKMYGLPPTAKLVESETSDDGSYKTYEATSEELVLPSVENNDYSYHFVKPVESTVQFRPNWGNRNLANHHTSFTEPAKETDIDSLEQTNYNYGVSQTENITKLTPPPSTIPKEPPFLQSSSNIQQRPPQQEKAILHSSYLQQTSTTSKNDQPFNTKPLSKKSSISQQKTPTGDIIKGDNSTNCSPKGDKSIYDYDDNFRYNTIKTKLEKIYTTSGPDISSIPGLTSSNNNLATKLMTNPNNVVMTTGEEAMTKKENSDNENDKIDFKSTSLNVPDFKVKVISEFKHQENTKSLSVAGKEDAWIVHDYNYIELISKSGNEKKRAKLGFNVHSVGISKSGNLILGSYGKIYRLINEKLEELANVGTYIVHGICNVEDNEDILVCLWAYDMGKVVRLSVNGEFKQTIEYDDNGYRLFISPQYITCTPLECDIWVTDNKTEQKSVTVTTNAGKLKFKYKGPNFGLSKQFSPRDLVATSQGHVLIADYFNQTIHVVSTDGHFLKFLLTTDQGLQQPCVMSKISADTYWITSENDHQNYQTHLIVQCAA